MKPIFPKWTNRIPLVIGVIVPVKLLVIVGLIWYYFSPEFTDVGYSPTQPVPFSHELHNGQLGLDCRYCHNTVERSAFAAIPPTETCMGCHKLVLPKSAKLQPVRDSAAGGKPVEWVNVHQLPDYVRFDHSAHLSAGVGCVNCHGRVDKMKVVQQDKSLSMSFCLDCHKNPEPKLGPKSEITNLRFDPKVAGYDPHSDPHRSRTVDPPTHCSGCHY